jgi:hypothetical protein
MRAMSTRCSSSKNHLSISFMRSERDQVERINPSSLYHPSLLKQEREPGAGDPSEPGS